jgi:hypothetical protein
MSRIETLAEFWTAAERLDPEGWAASRKAQAELESLRRDAARYRKWRTEYCQASHPGGAGTISEMLIDLADAWTEADVDEAIDAAMAKDAP